MILTVIINYGNLFQNEINYVNINNIINFIDSK